MLHEELRGQIKGMPAWCWGWTGRGPRVQLPNLHVVVMGPSRMLDGQIHPLLGHVFRGESNPSSWCVRAIDALVHCRGWGWPGGCVARWARSEARAKRLGSSARLCGRCPSIPPGLSWSLVLTLAGCSVRLPQSFLSAWARSSFFFLLSCPGAEGLPLRNRPMGTSLACEIVAVDYYCAL